MAQGGKIELGSCSEKERQKTVGESRTVAGAEERGDRLEEAGKERHKRKHFLWKKARKVGGH